MKSKTAEEAIKAEEVETQVTREDLYQDKITIVKTSTIKEETRTRTGNMAIQRINHLEAVKSISQSTDLNINLIVCYNCSIRLIYENDE